MKKLKAATVAVLCATALIAHPAHATSAPEGLSSVTYDGLSSGSSNLSSALESIRLGEDAEVYLGDLIPDVLEAILAKPYEPRQCFEGPADWVSNPKDEFDFHLEFKSVICPKNVGRGTYLRPGEGRGPYPG